ncbi:aspartate aminotransferase [Bifidobacterium aemilianum]|uniref:Aminotransferase n=1 Tax=Bifidobacterium aemilianum TaxID=2493120 RepID=A0A366K7C9_9BIFI|nr:pyridoxal phosphate-dependent aminotransferase [Bifidobacterium aemilianum]RBP97650.1 aspartate aminotransferase [Bifidobacterium aemilianum]
MADWQVFSDRINRVAPSATLAVDARAKALKAAGVDVIGFGVGQPNFPTPDYIVDAADAACRDETNYGYTATSGLPELRQAIADKTKRDSGYEVDADQVLVTNGGKQAVYEAFQILLNPGDEVIIPAPYWTSYPEMVRLAGGKPVTVLSTADQGFEPDLQALEAARSERTKAIIITSPSNPTGCIWSRETIRAIGQWALDHHIWVLSDEIYEHLHYGQAQTSYLGLELPELRDQLIVLNGVAKTYAMTGWRVGWMLAPKPVIQAAAKLQGQLTGNVSNISQRAAIAALTGSLDAVERMREAFDRRRQLITEAMNQIPGIYCPVPTGAFYAFPKVEGLLGRPLGPRGSQATSSQDLASLLLDQARIAVVPGEAFGAPGYLRFSYALSDEDLLEGMRRLREWVG